MKRLSAVSAEIMSENTHQLEDVIVKVGDSVKLRDGTRGQVAAMDCIKTPAGGVCQRMVLVMDDCTTRVLEHADVIAYYVIDATIVTTGCTDVPLPNMMYRED